MMGDGGIVDLWSIRGKPKSGLINSLQNVRVRKNVQANLGTLVSGIPNQLLVSFDDVREAIYGIAMISRLGGDFADRRVFLVFALIAHSNNDHFDREKIQKFAVTANGAFDRIGVGRALFGNLNGPRKLARIWV